ncbi:hypothetical protein [Flavobacterium sp.]
MKKLLLAIFLIGISVGYAQSFVCGNGDEPVNNSTNATPSQF